MGSLNFGSFANVNAVSTSKRTLKPYGSYLVKFEGAEIISGSKKDDPTATYQAIDLKFEGEEGVFNKRVFFPKDSDGERPKFKNSETGHEYERPSNFENTMYLMIQLLQVLNPAGAEKFQMAIPKAKDFAQLAEVFVKLVNVKKGNELYIKLVGRNSDGTIYAELPNCVGLNKQNELFPINAFSLKDDFKWSNYEMQEKAKYESAKPSAPKPKNNDPLGVEDNNSSSSGEMSTDELLDELGGL